MRFRRGVLTTSLVLLTSGAWTAQSQTTLGDGQMRAHIERRLSDDQLPGIAVAVHQGQVTLEGTVLNAWARHQAFEDARHVEGIKSVTCALVVQPRAGDAAIAREVERRVRDYAFYTIYENVEVAVKDGRVTLTGQVMAEASVRAMASIAAHVNGVIDVITMIRTLVASSRDDVIREEMAEGIYVDPLLSSEADNTRWPIRIIVEHGRVMLTGVVESEVARQAVDVIARSVSGVISVDNRLTQWGDTANVLAQCPARVAGCTAASLAAPANR